MTCSSSFLHAWNNERRGLARAQHLNNAYFDSYLGVVSTFLLVLRESPRRVFLTNGCKYNAEMFNDDNLINVCDATFYRCWIQTFLYYINSYLFFRKLCYLYSFILVYANHESLNNTQKHSATNRFDLGILIYTFYGVKNTTNQC